VVWRALATTSFVVGMVLLVGVVKMIFRRRRKAVSLKSEETDES
jgi:hypothetical protein